MSWNSTSKKRRKGHSRPKLNPFRFRKTVFTSVIGLVMACSLWVADAVQSTTMPQNDHEVVLYSNQTRDDLRKTFSTAIQDAKQSILLIIYTLTDPQIIQILKQKAEEGIDVTVICDAKACAGVKSKLGPKIHLFKRTPKGLMHQKILVVDGIQSWIGSANLTSESLRVHGNLVFAFHDKSMADMIIARAETMKVPQGKNSFFDRLSQSFNIGGHKVELWFLPDNPGALDRLLKIIGEAKESIRIAMFTWTHPKLTEAVIDAHLRGVNVEVVIDNNSGKGASAEVVYRLSNAGIPVALSHGSGLLHYKTLIADNKTLVNGSANWTRAAFKQNDDCFIILNNITETQLNKLDEMWKVITMESLPVQ